MQAGRPVIVKQTPQLAGPPDPQRNQPLEIHRQRHQPQLIGRSDGRGRQGQSGVARRCALGGLPRKLRIDLISARAVALLQADEAHRAGACFLFTEPAGLRIVCGLVTTPPSARSATARRRFRCSSRPSSTGSCQTSTREGVDRYQRPRPSRGSARTKQAPRPTWTCRNRPIQRLSATWSARTSRSGARDAPRPGDRPSPPTASPPVGDPWRRGRRPANRGHGPLRTADGRGAA